MRYVARERNSKEDIITESTKTLDFLYNTFIGRIILKLFTTKTFANIVALYMNSGLSKHRIKRFINKNDINVYEYDDKKYKSYNDFFIRKIKMGKRKINANNNAFISPCDAKLTYYSINDDLLFKVKNSIYSVSSIINDEKLAKKFNNGIALVFRLSPDDYHRYCFIDDGKIINNYKIDGYFNSVNPIVYDKYKIFKENTRECTYLKTKNFGNMMQIEVGALLVGKIKNKKISGSFYKGEEKGYFMYGGSTVIIMIEKNKVIIDKEIINNSLSGYETCVKYGEKIGIKLK